MVADSVSIDWARRLVSRASAVLDRRAAAATFLFAMITASTDDISSKDDPLSSAVFLALRTTRWWAVRTARDMRAHTAWSKVQAYVTGMAGTESVAAPVPLPPSGSRLRRYLYLYRSNSGPPAVYCPWWSSGRLFSSCCGGLQGGVRMKNTEGGRG